MLPVARSEWRTRLRDADPEVRAAVVRLLVRIDLAARRRRARRIACALRT